jgi:hypothetical protein
MLPGAWSLFGASLSPEAPYLGAAYAAPFFIAAPDTNQSPKPRLAKSAHSAFIGP